MCIGLKSPEIAAKTAVIQSIRPCAPACLSDPAVIEDSAAVV
jgi:hypothetical protein